MKPSEDSRAPASRLASHRFPSFTDGGGDAAIGANPADRDQFQPLFHGGATSDAYVTPDDQAADGNKQMEQARQRGYRNGVETGRQDACRMADDLLAPHVDRFLESLDRLASNQRFLADQASTSMLKLAVEISERIIGADAHATVVDLQQLRQALIEAIRQRYELQLRYHTRDLPNLQQLMECNGTKRWRTTDGLSIEPDPNVPQGAMINGSEVEQRPSIADQIRPSLQQLLMDLESDRKP